MATWQVPADYLTLPGENLRERLLKAKELIELLRAKESTAPIPDSRIDWTPWVKGNVHDLVDRNKYIVSPQHPKSTKGEYLTLDICVEELRYPKRLLLAGESELDDSRNRKREIIKDFEKLLAVKSAFKFMVFSSEKDGITNDVILKEIERGLDGYGHHLLGETYIFIDYNEDSGKNGSCIAHVWQPHLNGTNAPAKLVCIPPSGERDILDLMRNAEPDITIYTDLETFDSATDVDGLDSAIQS
jgi:hypothetical protein